MRKFITALALLLACGLSLATEVNQASEAELDGIKGIGPALSGKIIEARQQGPFRDWADLMRRVKGISARSADRLGEAGLTVNGTGYEAQAQRPARK